MESNTDFSFRSIETGKTRMSKKKKILIGIIVCFSVLLLVLIGLIIAYFVIKKKQKDNDDVIPTSDNPRKYIRLSKWMFFKNLSQLSSDIDSIDFSQILKDSSEVKVPHTWNNLDGQDGGSDYAQIPCSYQTSLDSISKQITDIQNKKVYIEFCGSNLKTTVYINGEKVGRHVGGYAKFRFDITKYLKNSLQTKSNTNPDLLTVVVDNSNQMEYYPYYADFTFFGGIYRDVNIVIINKASFDMNDYGSKSVYIKPNATNGEIEINATISNDDDQKGLKIHYQIYDNSNQLIFSQITPEIDHTKLTSMVKTKIENHHLWDGLNDPYLYRLRADLIETDGDDITILDRVESNFGFRTIEVNYNGFFLNGRKYQLRGVSRHQDRPNKGWAITNSEEKEDFDLIYEMGANAVRLSHYQQNETVYEYCDKIGLIVICEVPFISVFLNTTESELNLLDQLNEMVKQNFNHPCVALWGIMNEVGMNGESEDEYVLVRKLNEKAKNLDKSRQTYGAMLIATPPTSPLNQMPDVIGFNLYCGWYVGNVEMNGPLIDSIQKVEGNKPLSLTEYGAEAILKYHSDEPVSHDYTEEYQLIFHQKFYKIIEDKDLWGSFVWNMFDFASDLRDEGGVKGMNNKGLVSYDRKTKKESFFFYKSVWNKKEKFVHVCGSRFHDRATDDINVTIITGNAAFKNDLSIYLNNKLIQKVEKITENLIVVRVVLNNGKNVVKAVISDPSSNDVIVDDSVEFEKVKEPNPDYVFLNKTEIETKYPRPEGNYSVYDTFEDLQKSKNAWDVVSQMFSGFDIDSFLPLIKKERFIDLLISSGIVSDDVIMMFAKQLALIPKVSSFKRYY